nr:hypothetical protein [Candidatus Liberibacter asiaticus]
MLRGEKNEGKHKRTLVLSAENYSLQGEDNKILGKDMCSSYCPFFLNMCHQKKKRKRLLVIIIFVIKILKYPYLITIKDLRVRGI